MNFLKSAGVYSRAIFFLVVFLEILSLCAIVLFINYKISSSAEMFYIKKEDLSFYKHGNISLFYEPISKPDFNYLASKPDWLVKNPSYSINKDTLNDLLDYPPEKPNDVFRIVTLGDSFTFGLFVDTTSNYPELLEKYLGVTDPCRRKKYEVINLGVGGYDLEYAAERFIVRGQKYNPDLVLWLVKNEDYSYVLNKYQQIFLNQNKGSGKLDELFNRYKVFFFNLTSPADLEQHNTAVVKRFMDHYKSNLVFLKLPHYSDGVELDKFLKNKAKEREKTFIFELPDIVEKKGVFPETHPNETGYKMIAEALNSYIKLNSYLCKS